LTKKTVIVRNSAGTNLTEGVSMKKFFYLFVILFIAAGCAPNYGTYSTTERPAEENIINAPVDVVWENALVILPQERMTIKDANKKDYVIKARKAVTLLSIGDNVTISLVPKGDKQTVMNFKAEAVRGIGGFGHQERMAKDIFQKIKAASEK
jgi:hypothetical protein